MCQLYEILGSPSSVADDSSLLGYYAVLLDKYFTAC